MVDKTNNQPSLGEVVLDLDAVGKASAVPDLSSAVGNINMALGSYVQQAADISRMLEAWVRPIREALKAFHEMIQRIIKPIQESIASFAKPLEFLLSTQPIYYVQPRPITQEQTLDTHLPVAIGDYGFFVINGKPLKILNPASSRPGRLFATLLKRRSQLVTYEELKTELGSKDEIKKTFKSLKYQLKKQGYLFEYQLVRTQGIALIGVSKLQ